MQLHTLTGCLTLWMASLGVYRSLVRKVRVYHTNFLQGY